MVRKFSNKKPNYEFKMKKKCFEAVGLDTSGVARTEYR